MLAVHPKRQQNPFSTLTDSNFPPLHHHPYTASTISPSGFNGSRPPAIFLGNSPNLAVSPNFASPTPATSNRLMSGNYSLQPSPVIRVQDTTSTPAYPLTTDGYPAQQATPVDNIDLSTLWNTLGGGNNSDRMVASTATPALKTSVPGSNRRNRSHRRAPSVSSIGTSGSESPFSHGHATSNPFLPEPSPSMNVAAKITQTYGVDGSRVFSNHLPTPTHTPTNDSFMPTTYSTYGHQHGQGVDGPTPASIAMNRAMMEQAIGEEDIPGMSHSGRHSVSSIGQEPSTPHTTASDVFDDGFKVPSHDHIIQRPGGPKLDRTMPDVYQDDLYNPTAAAAAPSSITKSMQASAFLSPFRNKVSDALQAAQFARAQSPTSQPSRGVSPFRPDSPYVRDAVDRRIHPAAQPQLPTRSPMDLSHNSPPPQNSSRPTTISPKDAVLDYRPDAEDVMADVSLFGENVQGSYGQQYGRQNFANVGQGQFGGAAQNFGGFVTSGSRAGGGWPDASRANPAAPFAAAPLSQPQQHQQQQQQQQFPFAAPAASAFAPPDLSFATQNYRASANMQTKQQEETPDFPAHLTSMESSASEAPPSSNTSNIKHEQQQQQQQYTSSNNATINGAIKPDGYASLADTGTYTCTYHGCSLRFETPQKLQKHKREGHRQVTAQQQHAPGVGSGMTSAALANRNSQAGPHKCERINPTTGKPCNTIFSRPYDLTRHEDTIHNARKQKVRCALCVEEKTFSRNDALTRHMRVVHPDVDFPGKHRRRGAQD